MAPKHSLYVPENNSYRSLTLPGKPLNVAQFKAWISKAENMSTISLQEAKRLWQIEKDHLIR